MLDSNSASLAESMQTMRGMLSSHSASLAESMQSMRHAIQAWYIPCRTHAY